MTPASAPAVVRTTAPTAVRAAAQMTPPTAVRATAQVTAPPRARATTPTSRPPESARRPQRTSARRRGSSDAGSATTFTVVFAFFVIVLAGLLVDGGLAIHARQRAADIAEQAARAAADDVDVAHLRATGQARIKASGVACARAARLLRSYPEVAASRCRVSPNRDEAQVSVTIEVKLQLLGIVSGFTTFTMDSEATAEPQPGI